MLKRENQRKNLRRKAFSTLNEYFSIPDLTEDGEVISRRMYKYTDCGAFIKIETDQVIIGSIVEGCDFDTEYQYIKFEDLTPESLDAAIETTETQAHELWIWANETDMSTDPPTL
jgi:hypothetical protein